MSGTERCAVVVGHGEWAEGLLSALARVAGPQDNLWAVSNDGLDGRGLARAIGSVLEERGAGREAFLFSDLGGGSCGQVCLRLLEEGAVRAVFYGTNLPLLVEFVFLQDRPHGELVEALLEKSRRAIGVAE